MGRIQTIIHILNSHPASNPASLEFPERIARLLGVKPESDPDWIRSQEDPHLLVRLDQELTFGVQSGPVGLVTRALIREQVRSLVSASLDRIHAPLDRLTYLMNIAGSWGLGTMPREFVDLIDKAESDAVAGVEGQKQLVMVSYKCRTGSHWMELVTRRLDAFTREWLSRPHTAHEYAQYEGMLGSMSSFRQEFQSKRSFQFLRECAQAKTPEQFKDLAPDMPFKDDKRACSVFLTRWDTIALKAVKKCKTAHRLAGLYHSTPSDLYQVPGYKGRSRKLVVETLAKLIGE